MLQNQIIIITSVKVGTFGWTVGKYSFLGPVLYILCRDLRGKLMKGKTGEAGRDGVGERVRTKNK